MELYGNVKELYGKWKDCGTSLGAKFYTILSFAAWGRRVVNFSVTVYLSVKWTNQILFHSSECGTLGDGQMCLDLDQIHCDLPTPLASSPGWGILLGFFVHSLLWLSFFLMEFIFCRLSLLGFVHRWIRKKLSAKPLSLRWDLGSRNILEKKALVMLQFE